MLQPTSVRSSYKTLIGNIFSIAVSPNIVTGNLRSPTPILLNPPSLKLTYMGAMSKFDQENFSIDWDYALGTGNNDIDKS